MKAITQYNIRKSFTILSVILFTAIMFTSCEKVEDNYNNTTSSTAIDGRTEMVLINDSDWKIIDGQMSALLPSEFFIAGQDYNYVKVYSEESNDSKNEGDYTWVEMPNSKYTFRVEESKIFVQTKEDNPTVAQFLIAVKVN